MSQSVAHPDVPAVAVQVPDHELIRKIGAGSYGEVWLARHTRLGTLRAVKIVRRDQFDDARPFQREFDGIRRYEPISRGHPNLVAILHVGGTDDCFFYVMELADAEKTNIGRASLPGRPHLSTKQPHAMAIDDSSSVERPREGRGGRVPPPYRDNEDLEHYPPHTLRSELKQHGPLPIDRCLEIARALADALAHLHAHGLVHRDVKPSNVIFVAGIAKLADIGLVAAMNDSRSFVGTEGYIPPEGPGTPSADCYALGKLLYELSTGHDRTAWPEPPADLPTRPDRERLLELNAILHKACAPDPGQRYGDAKEMHGDLELLSAGKSVKQRHTAARRWRIAKKAAIMAAVGTLAGIGVVSLRHSRPQPLDPLTTGKNVGGYPPTVMRGTTNKAAWEQFRLGYFARRRDTVEGWQQATQHFSKAIELDPKFALAYNGLWGAQFSDTWLLTHAESDEWRRLAEKLVQLDKGLAETRKLLGFIRFWEWKWREAEAEYRKALRLNPDCVPAWILLGFHLSHVGRTEESLQVLDRGLQVDPNEPQLVKMKGHAYFVRRQFQKALDLYLESARREPLFGQGHFWAARAYLALTNYPAGIDEREKHDLLNDGPYPYRTKRNYGDLRRAFQEGGVSGYWRAELAHAQAHLNPTNDPYAFAQIYAFLGQKEQALDSLEKAYDRHDELIYLIFDECWDPWRDEPRFEAIRKKIRMPRHPNFQTQGDRAR